MPRSKSWLPTPSKSSPRRFIASTVGSSWNRFDRSGLAPVRSPAETTTVFGSAARSFSMCGGEGRGAAGGYVGNVGVAGLRAWRRSDRIVGSRPDDAVVTCGRLEVPVEIVEREDLHVHGRLRGRCRRGIRRGRGDPGNRGRGARSSRPRRRRARGEERGGSHNHRDRGGASRDHRAQWTTSPGALEERDLGPDQGQEAGPCGQAAIPGVAATDTCVSQGATCLTRALRLPLPSAFRYHRSH